MLSAQRETDYSSSHAAMQSAPSSSQQQQHDTASASLPMTAATATTFATTTRSSSLQFACLYTKHKTQKRKVWQDGRLVLCAGQRAVLHDANPPAGSSDPSLDQCELTLPQVQALQQQQLVSLQGMQLEMEKHLVTIEGPWMMGATAAVSVVHLRPTLAAPSQGMQKVLTKKFQVPAKKPPNPPAAMMTASFLARRKRPLQPGELQRQYYGVATSDLVAGHGPMLPSQHAEVHGMPPIPQPQYPVTGPRQLPPPQTFHADANAAAARPTPFTTVQGQPPQYATPTYRDHAQISTSSNNSMPHRALQQPFVGPPPPMISRHSSPPAMPIQPLQQNLNVPPNSGGGSISLSSPLQHKKPRSTIFNAPNGFDPGSFYGEDESDDDEQDTTAMPLPSPPSPFCFQPSESAAGEQRTDSSWMPPTDTNPWATQGPPQPPTGTSGPSPFRVQRHSSSSLLSSSQPGPFRFDPADPPTMRRPSVSSADDSSVDHDLLVLLGAAQPKADANEFTLPDHGDSSSSDDDD